MAKTEKSREELDKELMELLHPNPWAVADRAEEEAGDDHPGIVQ